jgi:predicted nucleic acid-binding protein
VRSARAVVDASVVIDLLIDSGSTARYIESRMASTSLHAPDHLAIEVANVLRRRRNRGLLSEGEAALAFQGFWRLPIQLWRLEPLADRTWQLGHNLSSYDAAYVALAEHIEAPLLTGDARLARASGPTCPFEVFG